LAYFEDQVGLTSKIEVLETKAFGLEGLSKTLIQQLSELKSSINKNINEDGSLSKELVAIENEFQIEELPLNPEKIEEELVAKEKEIQTKIEENNKLILEREVSYEKKRAQINMVREQIERSKELTGHYLINLEELYSTMLDLPLQDLYHRDEFLTFDHQDYLKGLKKCLSSDLSQNENLVPIKSFLDDIVEPFTQYLTQKKKENAERIIILTTQIEENTKQQNKLLKLKEEISKLKAKRTIYEKLTPFLLKDAFRDFALEVLEESLLQMANREISSLAEGRYELIHGKAGKRRELLVKDKWQGHTLRKVSTLSGGETFLLSLGLALGLSEMTRGQTEVESFFIDEGFGTLDGESISQVLDCLMRMQSRGKQIGLISHVRSLTDQIPIRLELEKNNFGESQIHLI
jgi:exonuclease SbcC